MTHPLIVSLQTLVEQAQSVPQEEAYLAQLTDRLAQVADERAKCVERLETGRGAEVKLATAERYLHDLINGVALPDVPVPISGAAEFLEGALALAEGAQAMAAVISESNSESAALPEPHESEALLDPEPDEVRPGAEAATLPSEDETASLSANSESNSEPELAEQPGGEEAQASEEQDAPALTIPERILAALAPDRQLTSRQLADELRLSSGNVSSALSKMIASDRLRNDTTYPPKYRLPETPTDEPQAEPVATTELEAESVGADAPITPLEEGAPSELLPAEDSAEHPSRSFLTPDQLQFPVLERIKLVLAAHPGLEVKQIAEGIRIPDGIVRRNLKTLELSRTVQSEGEYPALWSLHAGGADPGVPAAAVATAPKATPEPARDRDDRKAIQQAAAQVPAYTPPPVKTRLITERDEQAVLAALAARPNGRGSASLLSRGAAMSTDRVIEVLVHLAEAGRVIAPVEGEHLWSLT